MQTSKGRSYRLYNRFRESLDQANTQNEALEVFASVLPSFNADTAAILVQSDTYQQNLLVDLQTGEAEIWNDYQALHHAKRATLTRVLRLCTYPIALSDIQNHTYLRARLGALDELLAKQNYNDALAVPLFDKTARYSVMIISGRALTLSPSRRHWIIQAATDVAARIATIRVTARAQDRHIAIRPQRNLTPRQMDVAPWVVEGKSDWEIGRILNISHKTVNFHVENMKRIYGVKTRPQFVAAFISSGATPPSAITSIS